MYNVLEKIILEKLLNTQQLQLDKENYLSCLARLPGNYDKLNRKFTVLHITKYSNENSNDSSTEGSISSEFDKDVFNWRRFYQQIGPQNLPETTSSTH